MAENNQINGIDIKEIADTIQNTVLGTDLRREKVSLVSWKATKIGQGRGFVSNISKIELQWENIGDKCDLLPKTVVLKITTDETLKLAGPPVSTLVQDPNFFSNLHANEMKFYSFPHLPENIAIPKFFGGKNEEGHRFIILEDFSEKCTQVKEKDGLNKEQVFSVMKTLGQIHGFSMKHPEFMEQMTTDSGLNLERFSSVLLQTLDMVEALNIPNLPKQKLDKLRPFVQLEKLIFTFKESHLQFSIPKCLIHSDVWHSNILFTKKCDGSIGEELLALIDWQGCKIGTPAMDLARLICFNTSTNVRHEISVEALSTYLQVLNETSNMNFTLYQIQQAYEEVMPFTAAYYLMPLLMRLKMGAESQVMHFLTQKCITMIDEVIQNHCL